MGERERIGENRKDIGRKQSISEREGSQDRVRCKEGERMEGRRKERLTKRKDEEGETKEGKMDKKEGYLPDHLADGRDHET